jgi:hypothetical protein
MALSLAACRHWCRPPRLCRHGPRPLCGLVVKAVDARCHIMVYGNVFLLPLGQQEGFRRSRGLIFEPVNPPSVPERLRDARPICPNPTERAEPGAGVFVRIRQRAGVNRARRSAAQPGTGPFVRIRHGVKPESARASGGVPR